MAVGERFALMVAGRVPRFGAAFMGTLSLRPPQIFMRISTIDMPMADREVLAGGEQGAAFLDGYREAFRRGSIGVAQDACSPVTGASTSAMCACPRGCTMATPTPLSGSACAALRRRNP
jgi:hypothetical protein